MGNQRLVYRTLAVLLVVTQILLIEHILPLHERWFLHPDDHEVYVLAKQVAKTGTPYVPFDEGDNASLFVRPFEHVVDGRIVSQRPPGVFYLFAPAAAVSVEAAFVAMHIVAAAGFLVLFLFLERHYNGFAALLGLAAFAFSAPVLFWQAFLLSNFPGTLLLVISLFLLTHPRRRVQFTGLTCATAAALFRYEFALVAAMLGAAWTVSNARMLVLKEGWKSTSTAILAFTLPAVLLLMYSLLSYGTPNFVAVNIGLDQTAPEAEPNVSTTLQYTVGAIGTTNLETNYLTYLAPVSLALLAFISGALLLRRPRMHLVILSFGAAALTLLIFFLGNSFTPVSFRMSGSLTRYALPFIAFGAICVAHVASALDRKKGYKATITLAVLLAAGAGAALASGPEGFDAASDYVTLARLHHEKAADLSPDGVYVGEHLAKMLLDKKIITPLSIFESNPQRQTVDTMRNLLESDTHVYLSSTFDPQYRQWVRAEPGLELVPVDDGPFLEVRLRDTAK